MALPGRVGGSLPLDIAFPATRCFRDVLAAEGLGCRGRAGSKCSGVFAVPVHSPQCAENTKFLVRASYLEIYNEDVRDLLGAESKQKLGEGEWFKRAWWEEGLKGSALRSFCVVGQCLGLREIWGECGSEIPVV